MKICVVTDNEFKRIVKSKNIDESFDFYYSYLNKGFLEKYDRTQNFLPIRLKEAGKCFYEKYDLFFSLHCKQMFPPELVKNRCCINVHPGLNPYNRGWYPQVFSIINKLPAGVTIHEMDDKLDHGGIIFQEKVMIYDYETSFDVYRKIQLTEIRLIEQNLDTLLSGEYKLKKPLCEGNINYKKDFDKLCRIDLERVGTFREFIDILRATTFAKYNNAYFWDSYGNKIYISVNLKKDSGELF